MNIIDLADAKIYLINHRRPDWTVRITAYGAMAVCQRDSNDALAFIARQQLGNSPKFVINTRAGGVWHRDTLQSALDAVLHENRRMP